MAWELRDTELNLTHSHFKPELKIYEELRLNMDLLRKRHSNWEERNVSLFGEKYIC